MKEDLVNVLKQNKPGKYDKYWAHINKDCAYRNQIYKWRHMQQSYLTQMLNSPTLLPHFSLTCHPRLEPSLYQRLKEWVESEDNYIDDNKEDVEEEIQESQPVSEEYLDM